MNRGRRRIPVILGLGLLGSVISTTMALPRQRLLLQQATKVWTVTGSNPYRLLGYTWLSNQEVILLEDNDHPSLTLEDYHPKVERANVKTRAVKALSLLAKQMVSGRTQLLVSPDRKRALWAEIATDTSFLRGS